MTRISDREYAHRLEERLLRVDAEIAVIDETIAGLKATGKDSTGKMPSSAGAGAGKKSSAS